MLGKTANGLFWMSRYIERAETTARLIEAAHRIALTRLENPESQWLSVMKTSGMDAAFSIEHDAITQDNAIDWMLRSKNNPSSVLSSIGHARRNARLVRTALTRVVWEAINAAYMDISAQLERKVSERDLPDVLDMIGDRMRAIHGAVDSTMLRNDIFKFMRMGAFLERGDSTARILDVKYYVLLPSLNAVGSSIDNVQWEIILRSLSARGGFRMEYGPKAGASDIAQFLILDNRMPRSLRFCVTKLRENLQKLGTHDEKPNPSLVRIQHIEEKYLSFDIKEVFSYGLHDYIQRIVELLKEVSLQIEVDYRFHN